MLRMEVLERSADVWSLLPARRGPRPKTLLALPHIQLDQWPPADVSGDLIERSLQLADVRSKQSRMASPKSRALCLPDRCASGPREAFIDDHEFCHLHPLPEGRHLYRKNAQPIKQVGPEGIVLDCSLQIPVCSRYHSDVRSYRPAASKALELTFLQDTQ